MTIPLSPAAIADQHGLDRDRVRNYIRSNGVAPVARIGKTPVFSKRQAREIVQGIKAMGDHESSATTDKAGQTLPA